MRSTTIIVSVSLALLSACKPGSNGASTAKDDSSSPTAVGCSDLITNNPSSLAAGHCAVGISTSLLADNFYFGADTTANNQILQWDLSSVSKGISTDIHLFTWNIPNPTDVPPDTFIKFTADGDVQLYAATTAIAHSNTAGGHYDTLSFNEAGSLQLTLSTDNTVAAAAVAFVAQAN